MYYLVLVVMVSTGRVLGAGWIASLDLSPFKFLRFNYFIFPSHVVLGMCIYLALLSFVLVAVEVV